MKLNGYEIVKESLDKNNIVAPTNDAEFMRKVMLSVNAAKQSMQKFGMYRAMSFIVMTDEGYKAHGAIAIPHNVVDGKFADPDYTKHANHVPEKMKLGHVSIADGRMWLDPAGTKKSDALVCNAHSYITKRHYIVVAPYSKDENTKHIQWGPMKVLNKA